MSVKFVRCVSKVLQRVLRSWCDSSADDMLEGSKVRRFEGASIRHPTRAGGLTSAALGRRSPLSQTGK